MGDDSKTDLSPGMAKWMEALSGAGKLDKEQSKKFLDLIWDEGKLAKLPGISISGSSLRREVNTEDDGDNIFEVEYQVGDKPSVKISGTLEEIRARLTKTD